MFYKVIAVVNSFVFCKTMWKIDRLLSPKRRQPTKEPTNEKNHQAFLRSLHF